MHNLLFCAHTVCMNYVTNTFLLVSSSVRSKQLLSFVHYQGQKREQKHTTKTFVEFHNHSPPLTMVKSWCAFRLDNFSKCCSTNKISLEIHGEDQRSVKSAKSLSYGEILPKPNPEEVIHVPLTMVLPTLPSLDFVVANNVKISSEEHCDGDICKVQVRLNYL